MKKVYILVSVFLIFIVIITIIGGVMVTGNVKVSEDKDILVIQKNKEVYFSPYGYSLDNPNVIVNPYGNSPLTALVMFETDSYCEPSIRIVSKDGNSDIIYTFSKNKYHLLPIYGLYADYDNTVILSSEGKEKIITISTDGLPSDFSYVNDMKYDNFMFYNGNYPYAIDVNGDVRWYLNSNYYGDINVIDNSMIIIGSDRYNEKGNVISFYKMNFLGKIYNEYVIDNYYGKSVIFNDNVLALGDEVMLIDLQTGDIVNSYFANDNYDYIGVSDLHINVCRGEACYWYKEEDDELVAFDYVIDKPSNRFYSSTNYDTSVASRFGSLNETTPSNKKISLFSYDTGGDIGVTFTKEVDRLVVTNFNKEKVYVILDKFLDKRVYEVGDTLYINDTNLDGMYTIYVKIGNKIYKTDYYIEV